MMKLVLDTDVIVAAMRSPSGASSYILSAVDEAKVNMLLSQTLLLEYEAAFSQI